MDAITPPSLDAFAKKVVIGIPPARPAGARTSGLR